MKSEYESQFGILHIVAHNYWQDTGDIDALLVMDNALDNANDTFRRNQDNPDFWIVALASIQDVIEAEGKQEKLFPWFKRHGFTI